MACLNVSCNVVTVVFHVVCQRSVPIFSLRVYRDSLQRTDLNVPVLTITCCCRLDTSGYAQCASAGHAGGGD
eukprot:5295969-Pyramimonas_sp.AAC.2